MCCHCHSRWLFLSVSEAQVSAEGAVSTVLCQEVRQPLRGGGGEPQPAVLLPPQPPMSQTPSGYGGGAGQGVQWPGGQDILGILRLDPRHHGGVFLPTSAVIPGAQSRAPLDWTTKTVFIAHHTDKASNMIKNAQNHNDNYKFQGWDRYDNEAKSPRWSNQSDLHGKDVLYLYRSVHEQQYENNWLAFLSCDIGVVVLMVPDPSTTYLNYMLLFQYDVE